MTNYRDALTGQWTTAADAAARPAETVAETVPARHETPPALLDALLAMNAAIDQFVAAKAAIEGGTPLSDSGFDAVLLFAEIAAVEVPRLLDRLAHMTEARDNARAEVGRLTALLAEVRATAEHYDGIGPARAVAPILRILDGADLRACGGDRLRSDFTGSGRCHAPKADR